MEFIYLFIMSVLSIILIFFAFKTGLHYGSKIKNDIPIDKPTINPVNAIKAHKEEVKVKEQKTREEEIDQINLENIDNYDGTGLGQKMFPEK